MDSFEIKHCLCKRLMQIADTNGTCNKVGVLTVHVSRHSICHFPHSPFFYAFHPEFSIISCLLSIFVLISLEIPLLRFSLLSFFFCTCANIRICHSSTWWWKALVTKWHLRETWNQDGNAELIWNNYTQLPVKSQDQHPKVYPMVAQK